MTTTIALKSTRAVIVSQDKPVAKPIIFRGADATSRSDALEAVSTIAYAEGISRSELLTRLRIVFGKKPSDAVVAAAQIEFVIGRVAARLSDADLPKAGMLGGDKIDFARKVVTLFAMPHKDGVDPSKSRKAPEGRRTPAQHKAVRAATEAWSMVKADLGLSAAKTQKQRDAEKAAKAKRGAHPAGSVGSPAAKDTPAISAAAQLVNGKQSAQDVRNHVRAQMQSLFDYINKNAKAAETPISTVVRDAHKALAKALALIESTAE